MGLGSGTQLALSISTALAKVLNVKASTQELAIAMGRAKRTGVGTAIFQKGGFVVDGGRIAQNCVCIAEKFPPLIYRQKFPEEWRFIVAVPNVKKGLVSDQEKTAFSKVPIMPSEQVGKMCRLIMLKLLPAIAEKDLENFGDALTQIQVITGNAFANVQGGTYSSQASSECITLMQQLGIHGVGQSSWGPTIYGVTEKENAKQIRINIQTYLRKTVGGQVFVARANNKGATIKIIR